MTARLQDENKDGLGSGLLSRECEIDHGIRRRFGNRFGHSDGVGERDDIYCVSNVFQPMNY